MNRIHLNFKMFQCVVFIVSGVKLGHITQGIQVAQFHQTAHAPSSSYGAPGKSRFYCYDLN